MTNDEKLRHSKTPFYTRIKEYAESKVVPFDVPGHKLGHLQNELQTYLGSNVFKLDANAPRGCDNLLNPTGVIKEAQELMAEAFDADSAFFLINGTTQGILAAIMSGTRANDKIILPRNVHKSVINALIFSGAIPIFIKPTIDNVLGIANGITYEDVEKTIKEHPDAKMLFLINPTYFGVVSDITRIIKLCHENGIKVFVDEAHGAHFYFSSNLPLGAMVAGADCSCVSIHKTLGSFTQSSVLLTKGPKVDQQRLKTTLNMMTSTSPSSLLMASLDVTRKQMYLYGEELFNNVITLAENARLKINKIPGIEAITPEYFLSKGEFGFDQTRLIIKVSDLGLTGFDVYKILKDKFNIQMELAETNLVLAILSPGSTSKDINQLVKALEKISRDILALNKEPIHAKVIYNEPIYKMRPRDAFHSNHIYVERDEAEGYVAAESIMIYPPGIPLVIPGEVITKEIIYALDKYQYLGSTIYSDSKNNLIKVVDPNKSKILKKENK